VRPGDALVALESPGFRSNGFSLLRGTLQRAFGDDWHDAPGPGATWGELALLPSGDGPRAATPAQFSAGQTLLLDARLGHEVLGQRGAGETYLFAQVTGADKATDRAAAPPVNLGIVIDKSGSMKGERIANALSAAVLAVERMRDGDKVTVVSFAVASEVVVPPTVIGPDTRAGIEARIRGIRLGGDTFISCFL